MASEQRRHQQLQIAAEETREALQYAERSFQQGASDYLTVLSAQQSLLTNELTLADSATAATVALVDLYKALGGGWEPADIAAQPAAVGVQPAAVGARRDATPAVADERLAPVRPAPQAPQPATR